MLDETWKRIIDPDESVFLTSGILLYLSSGKGRGIVLTVTAPLFSHRDGDPRQRRLGEIQLTVRYVCLRHCLRVLVNGCR